MLHFSVATLCLLSAVGLKLLVA